MGPKLPKQGVLGEQQPSPHTPLTFHVSKTLLPFRMSSYGLFKSNHFTNLILSLPLSMLELKKRKVKRLICVVFTEATVSDASMEATPLSVLHLNVLNSNIGNKEAEFACRNVTH
jgi:hypothetical protein